MKIPNNNYSRSFYGYKTNFAKNTLLADKKAINEYKTQIRDRKAGAFITEGLSAMGGLCMLSITALSSFFLTKGLIQSIPMNIFAGAAVTPVGAFFTGLFYKLYKIEKQENFEDLIEIEERYYPDIEPPSDIINQENQLYNKYKYGNIIEYISNEKCTPKELYGFLCKITSNPDQAKQFVKEFSSNPREGLYLKSMLIKKLGNNQKAELYYNNWYNDEKYGYRKIYNDYYKHELFEKAQDLMTIVKQSPNIGTWAFKNKAKELGTKLILGELPSDFGDENDFKDILKELKKLSKTKDKQTPLPITVNNKNYLVTKINSGHSAKEKYIIEPENSNKKYVLKFSPYQVLGNTDRSRKFNDSFMLRGDSPYLDALVDFYLKENDCPNAPDIKYFDYNEKAVLYEMTEGKQLKVEDMDFYNAYLLNNSENLKDLKDLGVQINDINYKNILRTKDGTLVIVDTGHAQYSHPFRPMVQGINISLSNLCGRELA